MVLPHHHQAKVLKYPLNENFLSLQIVTLKSQLIFSFWGHYKILKLMGMGHHIKKRKLYV
ncbi:hypothetical protein COM59_25690 [Bacillus pseudomycoides]|nr:hypothetical protein COM59_25690 [Bacillus pseudomycoides]